MGNIAVLQNSRTTEYLQELRDTYEEQAALEMEVHGASDRFHSLARSYHVLASQVGYREDLS